MAIKNLFSSRQRLLNQTDDQDYNYDSLSDTLKVQVVHIWNDVLGNAQDFASKNVRKEYEYLVETLCREFGKFYLGDKSVDGERDYRKELIDYFLAEKDINRLLDTIELSFLSIKNTANNIAYLQKTNAQNLADQAVFELNERFIQHDLGYRLVDGQIVALPSRKIVDEPMPESVPMPAPEPTFQDNSQMGFVEAVATDYTN